LGYGCRHANRNSRNGSDGEYTTDHVVPPLSVSGSRSGKVLAKTPFLNAIAQA
jgi:hypothetical protein